MLLLRAGIGRARPHSRRAVARRLDLRVRRVRKLERRGLRTARALERRGACVRGGGAATTSAHGIAAGGRSPDGLIPPPAAPKSAGGGSGPGDGRAVGNRGGSSSGDVRGESLVQLPSPLDAPPGRPVEPGGLSVAIGIGLILLALLAGFATPHLRARLRSGRPA